MSDRLVERIRTSARFARLERTRSSFAWTLAIVMLLIYYGFIFWVAFAPASMATNVGGQITLGFPLGLFVIVSAIVLTGVYVWRANGEFDRETQAIIKEIGA